MDPEASRLWMLSGPRGAGKTAFCRRLAEQARGAGWDVAGLLSPAIFEAGAKTGILAEDLRSGEKRPLASGTPHPPFDLHLGNWHFDPGVLDWGSRVFETCLPCDLLIVDELGPLELLRAEGWTSALAALRQPHYRLGVVVVRPELQPQAAAALPLRGSIPLKGIPSPEAEAVFWWKWLSDESYT